MVFLILKINGNNFVFLFDQLNLIGGIGHKRKKKLRGIVCLFFVSGNSWASLFCYYFFFLSLFTSFMFLRCILLVFESNIILECLCLYVDDLFVFFIKDLFACDIRIRTANVLIQLWFFQSDEMTDESSPAPRQIQLIHFNNILECFYFTFTLFRSQLFQSNWLEFLGIRENNLLSLFAIVIAQRIL